MPPSSGTHPFLTVVPMMISSDITDGFISEETIVSKLQGSPYNGRGRSHWLAAKDPTRYRESVFICARITYMLCSLTWVSWTNNDTNPLYSGPHPGSSEHMCIILIKEIVFRPKSIGWLDSDSDMISWVSQGGVLSVSFASLSSVLTKNLPHSKGTINASRVIEITF